MSYMLWVLGVFFLLFKLLNLDQYHFTMLIQLGPWTVSHLLITLSRK